MAIGASARYRTAFPVIVASQVGCIGLNVCVTYGLGNTHNQTHTCMIRKLRKSRTTSGYKIGTCLKPCFASDISTHKILKIKNISN
jgi:hypothetical protein